MAGKDHSHAVRKAIVEKLRATSALTTLLGAANKIYDAMPERLPQRPYIRYGVPIVIPDEATCVVGSDIDVTIHVFDEGPDNDRLYQISKLVAETLDEAALVLSDGYLRWINWTGTQPLTEEASRHLHHSVVTFNAVTGEDPA